MKNDRKWREDDAIWKLLGEAAPKRAGARFTDDTVRLVKLLPKADPWWPGLLLRWSPVAACGAVAAILVFTGMDRNDSDPQVAAVAENAEKTWGEIQQVAEDEMLAAAVDHLDEFSDQELASLIGF